MKDYYLLVGLNSKEFKIINVVQNSNGLIDVEIENRKTKVRCPICNKFTKNNIKKCFYIIIFFLMFFFFIIFYNKILSKFIYMLLTINSIYDMVLIVWMEEKF